MSSSENPKTDEVEEQDDSRAGRGRSSAANHIAPGLKPSQPAAGNSIEDADFVPKFSEVRSRHGLRDGDAEDKIVPAEQSPPGTQSETSASLLSAAALAIEMTAASSFDALPVTEVGNFVKSLSDITMPETRPEVSSSHLNPEFGYHNVSEPKDEPRQPPAQLPPPPKTVVQYQKHLADPSTSKVDSLISQSENLDSIWEVPDRTQSLSSETQPPVLNQNSNANQFSHQGDITADGGMHFSPHGYDSSSMSPLSPKQDSLTLPENLTEQPRPQPASGRVSGSFRPDHQLAQAQFFAQMQTPSIDEIGLARKNRSAQIRSSLYWVVKEARLVTHGVFSDYEPPRGRTYADLSASSARQQNEVVAGQPTPDHNPQPTNAREPAPLTVSPHKQPQSDFAPPLPGAPAQRLLTQNSLEAVRSEAPPAKLRAVPYIAGTADYLANRDESPTIRFPEDAWELQCESQLPSEVSPEPPPSQSIPTPQAPAGTTESPPAKPEPVNDALLENAELSSALPAPSPQPVTIKPEQEPPAPKAVVAEPAKHPPERLREQSTTSDQMRKQSTTPERVHEQATTSERVREQGKTAERARDQSATSERRARDLRTTDQHKTDQRRTDQRTTRDGMIKVPFLGFVKRDDLKKQAITLGSVLVLCVASAIVMYDTINANRKSAQSASERKNVSAPEPEIETRSELPSPIEEKGGKLDVVAAPDSKEPGLEAELARAFKLEQQFNYIDSMNTFDKVIELDGGKNPKSLHGRGRVLTKLRLYDRALEDLESADKLDPQNIDILIDLAAVKYLLGDYSESASDYEKILIANPKDVDALYGRGISYAGMGKNKEAIADFENVIKLKPRYDKAYRQMCTAYLALNQSDKAESTITMAMNTCGADADLYFSRALSRYQTGRKDFALEDYNEAIRLSPDRKEYYNDRGFVQMDLGKLEEARKDFDRALEIDPKYKLALDNLRRLRKLEKQAAR